MLARMAAVHLDAVLEPTRSLSPQGFARVMLALGGLSLIVSLVFFTIGAYPVAGFFGLDVLALYLVFRSSFRAQTVRTYVRVTTQTVDVRKVDARGGERWASLPSAFTRVERDTDPRGRDRLRLAASGRGCEIGEFLSPGERASLARRLREALMEARRARG